MKLIAGLGNPGEKYKNTRHNVGFLILDYMASSLNSDFNIKTSSYEALIHQQDHNKGLILLKPLTYMNRSGSAILSFLNNYKEEISDLLIIVDDFNLPLGTIRVRKGGSDGGHNGLADIIDKFGTQEFPRMRIGIGLEEPIINPDVIDFVLGDFSTDEMRIVNCLMPHYEECVNSFVNVGILHTMNKFNKNFLDK